MRRFKVGRIRSILAGLRKRIYVTDGYATSGYFEEAFY